MGVQTFIPKFQRFQGYLSQQYPQVARLEKLSLMEKIEEARDFDIFRKFVKQVRKMNKQQIDVAEIKNHIKSAYYQHGKQRKVDINNIKIELATKNLEQLHENNKKFGSFFTKLNIYNLKHPIANKIKNFAIASSIGILVNKDNIRQEKEKGNNASVLKKTGLLALAFGMIPIIHKPIKQAMKTGCNLMGSKLPLTALLSYTTISIAVALGIVYLVKKPLAEKLFSQDNVEPQKQEQDKQLDYIS